MEVFCGLRKFPYFCCMENFKEVLKQLGQELVRLAFVCTFGLLIQLSIILIVLFIFKANYSGVMYWITSLVGIASGDFIVSKIGLKYKIGWLI